MKSSVSYHVWGFTATGRAFIVRRMDLDIVIYAVIAAIVLVRLWSLFGRRNDDDPQRDNPFAAPASTTDVKEDIMKKSGQAARPQLTSTMKPFQAPLASLEGALEQTRVLDPTFDEKQFLQSVRSAFTMIVEDFAKGDMSRITRLLGPQVLPHFEKALEVRRGASETMESKIIRFKDVEISSARVEDKRSFLTVRFISEQQNVLRDASGKAVGGNEGQIEEITDFWTFARDVKSSDPNWILVETRS
jgi:predicted lipid-binding transport protein (Tim44 family)